MSYTLHKFYKVPSLEACQINNDLDIADKYPLYAFSTNKEFVKYFMRVYDIENHFIHIKSKVSKKEYVNFANARRGSLLEKTPLLTRDKKTGKPVHKDIVCTWSEHEYLQSYIDSEILSNSDFSPSWDCNPMIFQYPYRKALDTLEYIRCYKLFTDKLPFLSDEYDDYSPPNITFDELALHIFLIKDLLR